LSTMKSRYFAEKRFVVAGTSAGAASLAQYMIFRGNSREALLKGRIETTNGLGFIEKCMFDTHFIARGRFGRLLQALVYKQCLLGVGLAEDTAIVLKGGKMGNVIGTGPVILFDLSKILQRPRANRELNVCKAVENIRLHILREGSVFFVDRLAGLSLEA
jgi:cyanophycinase